MSRSNNMQKQTVNQAVFEKSIVNQGIDVRSDNQFQYWSAIRCSIASIQNCASRVR